MTQLLPLDDISLNCLECFDGCNGCNGCNGHSDGFYGYTRFWQPTHMSIGHIQDESGELFGRSLSQHCFNNLGGHHVNTLAGHCVNILGGACVNTFGGAQINTVGGARINILEGVPVNISIIRMSSGQHLCDEDVFEATL